MAAVHALPTADDAALDADERVLRLALDRRNQRAARVRGRGAPVALYYPATGAAVEIDPTTGRLSAGGPVGPQPAATNHGSDGEVG